MSLKKEIVWRVGLVYVFMLLLGIAILAKVLYLQIIEGPKWREKAQILSLKDITIEANRGDIMDADGRLLASSVPFYEIRLDTRSTGMDSYMFNKKIDSLALCLSRLFRDKPASAYKNEILKARRNGERYHLLKRRVSYIQLKEMRKFPIFRLGANKGGFMPIQTNMRIQPHASLASRTIGYTTQGERGNVVGIEGAFDEELSGVNGIRLMQRLPGNVWMPVNDGNEVEPKDGMDVLSTIDVNIQDVAENALRKQLSRHNAHHGSAILMEVKTGEIKAIANLEKTSSGAYKETYNYAIGESAEPGSTFKLASMIAVLEDGYIDLDDTINTGKGEIMFYDKKVIDTKEGGHGMLTVKEIFEVSSNVGISKIITRYYKGNEEKFINRLYRMNLNSKVGIDIKGEGAPEIKFPDDKYWSGVSLPMMSIGYEVRMAPIQILTLYNAVANNGRMVRPRIVKEVSYHGNTVRTYDPEIINQSICSRSTLKKVRSMLEGVVENGTASNLKNSTYKIAGKTGTAQIARKGKGYKEQGRLSYQASFVGYFPAENPQYSCIVVVNSPSNDVYYGNLVAGPVFKEIADKVYATSFEIHESVDDMELPENGESVLPYTKNSYYKELKYVLRHLDIEYNDDGVKTDWVVTNRTNEEIALKNRTIMKNLMPNVVGMGLKDGLFILENAGLHVDFSGRGSIVQQSISPGSVIQRGNSVWLQMSIN
ncbi:MAG: penicillin-binding protein [Bacteroidales bacterium]|jgi:cell division protein FtsI (penicillin-binding protein 3)|nr:penicillin-binding protein [Bacteroidales bacterium]